jgi:hypothetical protein
MERCNLGFPTTDLAVYKFDFSGQIAAHRAVIDRLMPSNRV